MDNNYQVYFDRLRSEIKKNKKLTKVSRQELFSTDLYDYVDANIVQETEVLPFFMHQVQDTENVSLPDIPPQEPMDRYTLALRDTAAEASAAIQQRQTRNEMYAEAERDDGHISMKYQSFCGKDREKEKKQKEDRKKTGLDYKI